MQDIIFPSPTKEEPRPVAQESVTYAPPAPPVARPVRVVAATIAADPPVIRVAKKKSAARAAVGWAVYLAFLAGVIVGTPRALAYFLDTPYPMAAITSGSMWPVLSTGDLIFISGVEASDLAVGDIVVYRNPSGGFTIHRVARLESDYFVTKGDANFDEDPPVAYRDLVGRMLNIYEKPLRIPKVGQISIAVSRFVQPSQAASPR
jgi:signal peptidase I